MVPISERIMVQPGDMIGVHYDSQSTHGVLSFCNNINVNGDCGCDVCTLSRVIVTISLRDEDLHIGYILSLPIEAKQSTGNRLPSLRAYTGMLCQ